MSKALDSALRLLTRRDHTRRELELKLRHKGFSAKQVERALARVEDFGYLNDTRTAAILAEQLTGRGYGVLRVRYALGQKGVDAATVEKALACCGGDQKQAELAQCALEKRRTRLDRESDPLKRRHRAYRFLAGRGFSAVVIRQVLGDFEDDFI